MKQTEVVNSYRTIAEGRCSEITEKKSRFITNMSLAETEQEAVGFIDKMKKQYWDAGHNCFAYIIGKNAETVRCSDDGEPNGTAGRPMLEVLMKEDIRNAVVVVTRYFGGTLLGTGGLVRAYTQAVKAGIATSSIVRMRYGIKIAVTANYNDVGKVQYIFGKRGITNYDSEYMDKVTFTVILPVEDAAALQKDITEATNAMARLTEFEHLFFIDKKQGV